MSLEILYFNLISSVVGLEWILNFKLGGAIFKFKTFSFWFRLEGSNSTKQARLARTIDSRCRFAAYA